MPKSLQVITDTPKPVLTKYTEGKIYFNLKFIIYFRMKTIMISACKITPAIHTYILNFPSIPSSQTAISIKDILKPENKDIPTAELNSPIQDLKSKNIFTITIITIKIDATMAKSPKNSIVLLIISDKNTSDNKSKVTGRGIFDTNFFNYLTSYNNIRSNPSIYYIMNCEKMQQKKKPVETTGKILQILFNKFVYSSSVSSTSYFRLDGTHYLSHILHRSSSDFRNSLKYYFF